MLHPTDRGTPRSPPIHRTARRQPLSVRWVRACQTAQRASGGVDGEERPIATNARTPRPATSTELSTRVVGMFLTNHRHPLRIDPAAGSLTHAAACRPCSQSRRPGSEPLPTHPPRHTASAVTTAPPHDRRCPSEATAGLVPGAAAPGTGANINETPQRSSAPTLAGPRTGWIVQRSGEGRRERSLVVPPFAERLATSTRPTPRHTGDRSVSARTGPARQTDGRLVWAGWRG